MRKLLCSTAAGSVASLLVIASAGAGYAAGETIGYSSPFLFSQFQVILQDQTVAAAEGGRTEDAGADQCRRRLRQADHRRPQPDRRRRQGPDRRRQRQQGDHPGARLRRRRRTCRSSRSTSDRTAEASMRSCAPTIIGMGWIACTDMAKAIGDSGKVLSLQGAHTSINGRERSEGLPRLHHARSIRTSS